MNLSQTTIEIFGIIRKHFSSQAGEYPVLPPTIRSIADRASVSSTNTVNYHIIRLVDAGLCLKDYRGHVYLTPSGAKYIVRVYNGGLQLKELKHDYDNCGIWELRARWLLKLINDEGCGDLGFVEHMSREECLAFLQKEDE